MKKSFMIYGAIGYSGRLVAEHAAIYGLQPILAGREAATIIELANKLGLPYRIFSLDRIEDIVHALTDVQLVLNTAGPFDDTVEPFLLACLQTKTHYLDFNGERKGFEVAQRFDQSARSAGVMILPAVGFDVVPSDCLALYLQKQLPDATDLKLGFATFPEAAMSRGTALTTLGQLGWPGMSRREGALADEPIAKLGRLIDFGVSKVFSVSVPWGDLLTAYHTTQIPNIQTYFAASRAIFYVMKFQFLFNWILRMAWFKNFCRKWIVRNLIGPSRMQRMRSSSVVWGQVTNPSGESRQALIHCPEVYEVTYHAALLIAREVQAGNQKAGLQTPAGVFGDSLILSVPGTRRKDL